MHAALGKLARGDQADAGVRPGHNGDAPGKALLLVCALQDGRNIPHNLSLRRRRLWLHCRPVNHEPLSEHARTEKPLGLLGPAVVGLVAAGLLALVTTSRPGARFSRHVSRASAPATIERESVRAEPGKEDVGTALAHIDDLVTAALEKGQLPGCVVVVGTGDHVLFKKAYGMRELVPARVPMTEDTVFDLASLTKPIATATSIMILAERGSLSLDAPVGKYVPEFAKGPKGQITIRELLLHTSGLPAETPLADYEHGHAEALKKIAAARPKEEPEKRFLYSDVGYLVLEEVVRRVAKQDFAVFAHDAIFARLGMNETTFLPPPELRDRAAPTEQVDGVWLRGQVHDPRARRLGGVAGNAGLFSTADDLTRYAQALLGDGARKDARILSPKSVRAMMATHDVPGGLRAPGWDVMGAFSASRGGSLSRRAVGHGGFTGTSLWMDPEKDLFVLFLSNRVHPDGKGNVNHLIGDIATLAGNQFGPFGASPAGAVPAVAPHTPPAVETGLDVLASENCARLHGAQVGLITNASGRARDGSRTVEVLGHCGDLHLVALFSPEHGLDGDKDERIADGVDQRSGLPVYSLYGSGFAPKPVQLAGIDTLVFDIQDAGARFYTYGSTLHNALRVAADKGLRFVVLDRPNPIGGKEVAGPMSVDTVHTFVNYHPLPVRPGLTVGELAELLDAEEHLGARLHVVQMRGWDQRPSYDDTGLAWVPPSPNLRSPETALLYPGVALLEGTNVSVGRGTDTPFEVLGAPFVEGPALAAALAAEHLAGVRFEATTFVPEANPYAQTPCGGVRLVVTDRNAFEPVRTGIALARALHALYRDKWDAKHLDAIIANPTVTKDILAGQSLAEIEGDWQPALLAFRRRRENTCSTTRASPRPFPAPPHPTFDCIRCRKRRGRRGRRLIE